MPSAAGADDRFVMVSMKGSWPSLAEFSHEFFARTHHHRLACIEVLREFLSRRSADPPAADLR
jgi:hypothetical protein